MLNTCIRQLFTSKASLEGMIDLVLRERINQVLREREAIGLGGLMLSLGHRLPGKLDLQLELHHSSEQQQEDHSSQEGSTSSTIFSGRDHDPSYIRLC
jgi:hypothetical protein